MNVLPALMLAFGALALVRSVCWQIRGEDTGALVLALVGALDIFIGLLAL